MLIKTWYISKIVLYVKFLQVVYVVACSGVALEGAVGYAGAYG